MQFNSVFRQIATKISQITGSPKTFVLAIILVLTWAISGPFFNFSNTWQLVINTTTTILTFLMVFLIQNTQNRDTRAIHLKLDELIRTGKGRNRLINIEDVEDEELEKLHEEFKNDYEKYKRELEARRKKASQ
jgi:low affinity Fe/Cu permease